MKNKVLELGDRVFYKYNSTKMRWEQYQLEDLKTGDVFIVYEVRDVQVPTKSKLGVRFIDSGGNNVWVASSDPYKDKEGFLTINTLY